MLSPDDLKQIGDLLDSKLTASEDRIVTRVNREVTDLADVNRMALNTLDNHEHRLVQVEDNLELKTAA